MRRPHLCRGDDVRTDSPGRYQISADGDASNFHDLVFDGSRYAVVWTSREPGKIGIQGQFIGTDGVKGTSFLIADNDAATSPKIARAGDGFLVVYYTNNGISGASWTPAGMSARYPDLLGREHSEYPDHRGRGEPACRLAGRPHLRVDGWDVYGRLVSPSGAFVSNDFRIGPTQGSQSFPIGSFNGENYVVIWTQEATVNSAEKDFYGARVSQAGTVLDPDGFAVCTAPGTQTTLNADCTAGPNGATALAWTDARTGLTSLYWTTVSREGAVLDGSSSSGRLVFQDTSFPPGYPSITYNGREYVSSLDPGRGHRVAGRHRWHRPTLQRVPVIYGTNPTRTACAYDGTNYLISWAAFSSGQSSRSR